jgi:hypothetical protein
MKHFILIGCCFFLFSCMQNTGVSNAANQQIDSLNKLVQQLKKERYKPGLGEFMGGIQMLHAKLWFAGINQNWKLANFEMDEIKETLGFIKEFETDRPETKNLTMLNPALDSLNLAIETKNILAFKNSFRQLTNTCNSCHRISNFEFNKITIPSAAPVVNQDFKPN